MKTLELENLSEDELAALKGGTWVCDPDTGDWYWVDRKSLDDPFPTGGI